MQGLDTNVLIRYLVQDDPDQSARASRLLEQECTADEPAWVSHIVLCETVWVLESCYGQDRADVLRVLETLLSVAPIEVEARDVVWAALEDFRTGKADFSDHLLGRANLASGCRSTVTFDRKAAASPGFEGL